MASDYPKQTLVQSKGTLLTPGVYWYSWSTALPTVLFQGARSTQPQASTSIGGWTLRNNSLFSLTFPCQFQAQGEDAYFDLLSPDPIPGLDIPVTFSGGTDLATGKITLPAIPGCMRQLTLQYVDLTLASRIVQMYPPTSSTAFEGIASPLTTFQLAGLIRW